MSDSGFEADVGGGTAAEVSLEFEFLQTASETVSSSGDRVGKTELQKDKEEDSNLEANGDCVLGDKDEEKFDASEEHEAEKEEEKPEAQKCEEGHEEVTKDEEKSAENADTEKPETVKEETKNEVRPEAKEPEEKADVPSEQDAKNDEIRPGNSEKPETKDENYSHVLQETKNEPKEDSEHDTHTDDVAAQKTDESEETTNSKDHDCHRTTSESSESSSSSPHSPRASRTGFRFLGVDFAPLNTPMRRRLQTLAVAQWLLSITILPILCVLLLAFLLFTPLAPLVLAYIGWVLVFDRKTSQRGGRRWEWVRRWSLWRHYRDYFPISLVKSAELDPAHNYLIGYHPHGIISCGAFCNFGTEATGFSAKFPGIKPHLLTLRMNFFWPLLRGYHLAAGVCDVSRPSIQWILGKEGGGNAAIIVVGGAQEALDARPGNYRLTLLKRKGFTRMALQTGAHLVPCFSFGENDLFKQAANPPGSKVRAFQQQFKGAMGSSPPLFYGRGVFNYSFGMMPFRHGVITVVGAPIPVVKCPEPSQEQVDSLHAEYMARLADLFDTYKGRYGVTEDVKLEFV